MTKREVCFSDGVIAWVLEARIKDHYSGVIEASPGTIAQTSFQHGIPAIHRRIDDIKAGRIKGHYCLEPALMEETEYWARFCEGEPHVRCSDKCLKDYEIEARVKTMYDDDKFYEVTLEWFVSTNEWATMPLLELIRKAVSTLEFKDVALYCDSFDLFDI